MQRVVRAEDYVKHTLAVIILSAGLALSAVAAPPQASSPELQKLAISLGHWTFHGTSQNARTGAKGSWSWDEHCRWSQNNIFLECSFDNVWSGRRIQSLVVDTYNSTGHSYWHYEVYDSGKGEQPFISRMTIAGNVWTEYGPPSAGGGPPHERVVYVWTSPRRVEVKIEQSRDGVHWTTVDQGVGTKLGN